MSKIELPTDWNDAGQRTKYKTDVMRSLFGTGNIDLALQRYVETIDQIKAFKGYTSGDDWTKPGATEGNILDQWKKKLESAAAFVKQGLMTTQEFNNIAMQIPHMNEFLYQVLYANDFNIQQGYNQVEYRKQLFGKGIYGGKFKIRRPTRRRTSKYSPFGNTSQLKPHVRGWTQPHRQIPMESIGNDPMDIGSGMVGGARDLTKIAHPEKFLESMARRFRRKVYGKKRPSAWNRYVKDEISNNPVFRKAVKNGKKDREGLRKVMKQIARNYREGFAPSGHINIG